MTEMLHIPMEEELGERMDWLIRFRWLTGLGALFIVLMANYLLPELLPMPFLLATIAGLTTCNALLLFYSRRLGSLEASPKHYANFTHLQLVLDILFLTVFLHFVGGLETPLFFFYLIYVVIASILLPRAASFAYAGLASLLYLALLVLEWLEFIPHYNLSGFRSPLRFQQPIHIFAVSFTLTTTALLTAYFASTIVARLRERERELGRVNEELVNLDRLRIHFLAMASHDLKAPLVAVQTYLQVILGGFTGDINDEQREMLERSSIRIEELLKLINDLLDATRIKAGQIVEEMEEISLAEVMEDALENVRSPAEEKGLELLAEVPEDLPEIVGAPRRLVQVLTNLLNNAVQFTPSGGRVTVRAREEADHLWVEVMDTGIGILPEDMPRIFEEFYRGKNVETKGAGLGLAIAKKIVEAHGGEIWAESPYPESEKGSKFTFTLLKDGRKGKEEKEKVVSSFSGGGA